MHTIPNVFVGVVDILGYDSLETTVQRFGVESSQALMTEVYQRLESTINGFRTGSSITWHQYGDGFVFHSPTDDIAHLPVFVQQSCTLLALSLNQSIPLRVAITQNTLNIDKIANGLTISGPGWTVLREIEKSLNWMGGLLYLPTYDGTHDPTVTHLVNTTWLVIRQLQGPNPHFTPPFKANLGFETTRTWFLNWHKILQLPKHQLDPIIRQWWLQIAHDKQINASQQVQEKQDNTIAFSDYCRQLYEAASLVFFSDINKDIDMQAIGPGP